MKTDQPNTREKHWLESVVELGCVFDGKPAQIHHCAGRTAKHDHIEIGHWWILPLCPECHAWIHEQGHRRKVIEKTLFAQAVFVKAEELTNGETPCGVFRAIQEYRR